MCFPPFSIFLASLCFHVQFTGLQAALPPAVHLLTLSQWDTDMVLLRLEHQFQTRESKVNTQPVTVNLQV